MVDHIYGRGISLVPPQRPHMFAKEIEMYVDYFEKLVSTSSHTESKIDTLLEWKKNLEEGLDYCLEIAQTPPYPGENLTSVSTCVKQQRRRLERICAGFREGNRLAS